MKNETVQCVLWLCRINPWGYTWTRTLWLLFHLTDNRSSWHTHQVTAWCYQSLSMHISTHKYVDVRQTNCEIDADKRFTGTLNPKKPQIAHLMKWYCLFIFTSAQQQTLVLSSFLPVADSKPLWSALLRSVCIQEAVMICGLQLSMCMYVYFIWMSRQLCHV